MILKQMDLRRGMNRRTFPGCRGIPLGLPKDGNRSDFVSCAQGDVVHFIQLKSSRVPYPSSQHNRLPMHRGYWSSLVGGRRKRRTSARSTSLPAARLERISSTQVREAVPKPASRKASRRRRAFSGVANGTVKDNRMVTYPPPPSYPTRRRSR